MAQPFDCWCGANEDVCLGRVDGAAGLDAERLSGYWISGHIRDMLEETSNKNIVKAQLS